ncbi:MAG: guanylate kinase [Oscillospiraceae bacterium]|nr:guanylate kinase [Oscillospiraceae bacterium]
MRHKKGRVKLSKGKLLVLSGPSGVGKGTVLGELMNRRDDMCFSVSATTRRPREGEVDGVSYFFVSKERFEEMIRNNELLEYAQFVSNSYGTPRAYVEQQLEKGMNVILDIEVQGARNIVKMIPDAVTVYMIPPSYEELERRLRGRGTETEEQIQGRLQTAIDEAKAADFYRYIVVNDKLETAVNELDAIMTAEKIGYDNRKNILKEVFKL